MSKKLIAVAAAAALALTGLVALPASGAAITSVTLAHASNNAEQLTVSQTNADSAVAANTWAAARNVVFGESNTNATTRTAVRATVVTASAATITVTSTLGVKVASVITDSAGAAIKVDGGSQSISGTTPNASTSYVFYAWNTSTTAGAVTVDTGTSKLTFYVKGTLGFAYNVADVTFPSSLYTGQTGAKVTFRVTDAYGNPITTGSGITPTGFGATFGQATYNATTKLWESAISAIDEDNVAINVAVAGTVDVSANGFPKPVTSAFKLISAGSLAVQVTALTAQVAALQAQMADMRTKANSVTKKRWNRLVRAHRALGGTAKLK